MWFALATLAAVDPSGTALLNRVQRLGAIVEKLPGVPQQVAAHANAMSRFPISEVHARPNAFELTSEVLVAAYDSMTTDQQILQDLWLTQDELDGTFPDPLSDQNRVAFASPLAKRRLACSCPQRRHLFAHIQRT